MARKKRQAKKQMKLKINGEEQSLKEDEVFIKDWSKAKEETAAAEDQLRGDDFEWVLPEKDSKEVPEFKKTTGKEGTSHQKKPGSKMSLAPFVPKKLAKNKAGLLVSAALAVAIGLGFGLFVLKLVENPESGTALTDATPGVTADTGAGQAGSVSATMPDLTAAVVQGGVFSTEEAAESTSSQLASQGVPTVSMNVDDQQFLFVGIADNVTSAKAWADDYEAKGIDVYTKEFSVPEQQIKVDSQADANWIKEAPAVFGALAKAAAGAQATGQVDEQSLQTAETVIAQFKGQEIQQQAGIDMRDQLDDAYQQLSAFSASGDRESLTKAQQSLLNFLKVYYTAAHESSV
ncbi:hypothetical protein ACFSCZ_02300 [Siminovitchia sediminis]|uniref:SPOR domain-containing protein n=1 Tax=Siminovitchia sediminis TaxID=1274353 RepID=A0ABW4KE25_9BACI